MTLIERMIADGLSKVFDMRKRVFSPQITRMDTDGLACARGFWYTDCADGLAFARVFLVHGLFGWTRMGLLAQEFFLADLY